MKKVLLISGSNKKGFCDNILENIKPNISSCDYIKLRDYNIKNCIGCLACDKKGFCILNDDLKEITDKMLENDVIAFAIPNYFGSLSGFFKNFIDRLHYMYKRSTLKGKKIIFIYVGALIDTNITLSELTEATKNIEKYLEFDVIKRYAFSSREDIDINKLNDIINTLNEL